MEKKTQTGYKETGQDLLTILWLENLHFYGIFTEENLFNCSMLLGCLYEVTVSGRHLLRGELRSIQEP